MRSAVFGLCLVLSWPVIDQAQSSRAPAAQIPLPAVSWTCTMHPDVVDDSPGKCPRCGMDLVRARLVSVWTCPVHAVIEQDNPGRCRICGRDLVTATRALTFTCAGHPEINQLEPGRCADGSPMLARYTARPHGDHNPKHGGQFFMAPDNWHHIEGAYPRADRFRLYVYDDYTRPLAAAEARKVRGRIVTKEVVDDTTHAVREVTSAPLVVAGNGAYLEARIAPLALPAQITAKVAFGGGQKETRFDFTFPAYSKDVAAPAPASSSATPVPRAPAAPISASALIRDLKARDREVASLIKTGALGGIYVPALEAKDLALQIQALQASASPSDRNGAEMNAQVKRLVAAAYQLDNDGDLGDAQKIALTYQRFSAAVAGIDALLAPQP